MAVLGFNAGGAVTLADGSQLDSFGRLRVSNPRSLFQGSFDILDDTVRYDRLASGGATITRNANESCLELTVPAGTNARAVIQSKVKGPYEPGKSDRTLVTGNLGAPEANVTRELGRFDDSDGIFLRLADSTYSIVRRTSVSGAPVDNVIPRASWDDPLDGSGPSGRTYDFEQAILMVVDLAWLGVGRYRIGFVFEDGAIVYAHQGASVNTLPGVYMRSAKLPVRYEIRTGGVAPAAPATLKAICQAIHSDGGRENTGILRAIDNGVSALSIANGATGILAAVQIKSTTPRALVRLLSEVVAVTGSCVARVSLLLGGTLPAGAFTSVGAASSLEARTNIAGAVSGTPRVLWSSYLVTANSGGSIPELVDDDVALTYDDLNGAPVPLSLQVQNFTGQSRDFLGGIRLKEVL